MLLRLFGLCPVSKSQAVALFFAVRPIVPTGHHIKMCNKISPLNFIPIELVRFFPFLMETFPICRKISSANVWQIHIICLGRPNCAALHHYIPVYPGAGGIMATGSSIHITFSCEIILIVIRIGNCSLNPHPVGSLSTLQFSLNCTPGLMLGWE